MKIYKLYLSKGLKIFYPVMLILIILFALANVIFPIEGLPRPIAILWAVIIICVCYQYLKIPFEIRVLDGSNIEFRSFIRSTIISTKEIKSIKPWHNAVGLLIVKHSKGKIRLLNQFDNFHEFISFVKASNSNIEIRGC